MTHIDLEILPWPDESGQEQPALFIPRVSPGATVVFDKTLEVNETLSIEFCQAWPFDFGDLDNRFSIGAGEFVQKLIPTDTGNCTCPFSISGSEQNNIPSLQLVVGKCGVDWLGYSFEPKAGITICNMRLRAPSGELEIYFDKSRYFDSKVELKIGNQAFTLPAGVSGWTSPIFPFQESVSVQVKPGSAEAGGTGVVDIIVYP